MKNEISGEELDEITKVVKVAYGYDFSGYAIASLKRRVNRFCQIADISAYDLKYHIVNEKSFFFWFLESLTVNVTEMFRDPDFYKEMAATVLPVLSTYPIIKIWHAGCSTGEEAYSLAIMLHEAGLLERSKIYATDMNMTVIEKAKAGIISLSNMKDYTHNYIRAGGQRDFSDYYSAKYENALINKEIRKNITFSQHNLVTDFVFNEFHLICCRNVMIYFNKVLQNRVAGLFQQSLAHRGFLALGTKESLIFTDVAGKFEVVNATNKIYRLKAE